MANWLDKYNDDVPNAQNGIEGTMGGLTDQGFNYNGAWGGTMEYGGDIPQAQWGFQTLQSYLPIVQKFLSKTASDLSNKPAPNPVTGKIHSRESDYGGVNDLYNKYFGQPLKTNTVQLSKYRPTKEKDKSSVYYSVNDDLFKKQIVDEALGMGLKLGETKLARGYQQPSKEYKELLEKRSFLDKLKEPFYQFGVTPSENEIALNAAREKDRAKVSKSAAIGGHQVSRGSDERGEYISYYDKFDRTTGTGSSTAYGTGHPFEIYDKIYIDPKTGKPKLAMGGSIPGSVGFTYARTQSPAPSNGKYAKKTKASAQTGDSVVKTDTGGGGDTPNDGYIPIPGGFNRTITTGLSDAFDPTNPKWRGNDSTWLDMKRKNDSLTANLIKDAKSLPKSEWKKKYEGRSFKAWNGWLPIDFKFYDDYQNYNEENWIRSSHQAENELTMLNKFNANKEKFKKEASDFINQYKNQNEFLSNFPTEAAKKYGYAPGETLNPIEFLSKDAVSKAYYAINSNQGFTLPQDPTNEMTCINGVCTIESMIGVDFSPLKGKTGVYYDKKTGKTIPQYNPTWLEDKNYEKVGYRKLNPNEAPEAGDLAQYTNEGKPRHMELVLGYNPNRQALIVYNNYSQTNDNKPGEGKEIRPFSEGTYQPYQFEKTEYFRLTPEAAQKAASVNPGYPKWQQEKMEAKKALESSEDYKKFIEAQNLIKTNKEKYDQYSKMSEEWWNWRNGGKTSAQNGMEMKFYQEGLDWKPKNISKNGSWLSKYEEGGIIEDPMGQWAHPGEITRIPSNQITMQGVDYPVLGISDTGDTKMMQPGEEYKFKGKSVTEIPMAQDGITRGGYDDPDYVTGTSRRAFNKMVGMGNYLVPANAINSAADLAKTKGLDYGAITSGPADAVRHAAAAASVASRLPVPKFIGQYSPDLDRAIRIAGANLLGIGNEIMSPNSEGLWMDIKNNYQGSLIGSIRGLNQNDRNKMILNQLQKNKLTVDNPKKPKKENGGWLNKYK